MKNVTLKNIMLTALTCLALAACGGGGGNNGGNNGDNGGSNNGSNDAAQNQTPPTDNTGNQAGNNNDGGSQTGSTCTATPSWVGDTAATSQADFLALLNRYGQNGYRYLGNHYFPDGKILFTESADGTTFTVEDEQGYGMENYSGPFGGVAYFDGGVITGDGTSPITFTNTSPGSVTSSLFERDGCAPSYAYALAAAPTDAASLLVQLDAEGQQGYQYQGETVLGGAAYALYRQDAGSSATYSYATDVSVTSAADFVAQANGYGKSGYWFAGPVTLNSTALNLYAKNDASTATYVYDAQPAPADAASFVAQANAEGANGYRAWSAQTFGSDATATQLYIKDQTQSSTFAFAAPQTQQTTTGGFVWQANGLVSASPAYTAYYADLSFGGATNSFYFAAQNCTGLLCSTVALTPPGLAAQD